MAARTCSCRRSSSLDHRRSTVSRKAGSGRPRSSLPKLALTDSATALLQRSYLGRGARHLAHLATSAALVSR